MLKYQKRKDLNMGQKDVISKEILKNIARDISKHILHIEIQNDNHDQMHLRMHRYYSDILTRSTSSHSLLRWDV
jgi:hypothetical protein